MSKKQMTYEDIVAECRRLRSLAEDAELNFFIFLVKVETDCKAVWESAGHESFASFLRSNNLTEVKRYYNFVRGMKRTTPKKAAVLGVPLITRIGQPETVTSKAVEEMCRRAEAFHEVHGVVAKEQTVGGFAREVMASEKEPDIYRKRTELTRLREENAKLQAANAKLQAENSRLKDELATLQKKKKQMMA